MQIKKWYTKYAYIIKERKTETSFCDINMIFYDTNMLNFANKGCEKETDPCLQVLWNKGPS